MDDYLSPAALPPHVLDRDDMRTALRVRDFGAVFALAKKWGGISFQKIADACDIKAQRVGELARGQGEVTSLSKVEQITDAMRIPGEMVGLAPRPWERSSKPTVVTGTVIPAQQTTEEARPQAEIGLSYARSLTDTLATVASLGSSDVHRRSFLTNATFAVAALASPSRDWLLASLDQFDADKPRRVGPEQIDVMREAFGTFQEMDVIGGGGDTARRLVAQYLTEHVMPLVEQPQAPTVQQSLYEVASEQTYLAGWMAFDSGRHGLAERYLIQSLRLAQASGNRMLGAHVLAGLSDQATQLGYPEEGLNLARAGQHGLRGVHAPAALTDLYVLEARAHAVLGDVMAAVRAIGNAEQTYDTINHDNEPEWARFIDTAYVTGEIAASLRDMNDAGNAERFARESIAAAQQQKRNRRASLSQAVLAASHVQRGELEAATSAAHRALDLSDGIPSIRVTAAMEGLQGRLSGYEDQPEVQALMSRFRAV
ncbi:transcriptional regulator [Yinghuangia sp. ASG 101]|uniref:transcriptional regulator n=1 Tax=Yinghuangia sp. ASG 101 TaxID=2896848 RepID=UPI001E4E61E4|nr:transcriptional regulator [Yinghuangia sp. ASG 101]UGQ09368.1 transcriptional regulator [Yinghuangia sp. ASG 101]